MLGYGIVNDFDRVHIKDEHPRFEWAWADDDGLEKYYQFSTPTGTKYLLSNNMAFKDREEFHRLYKAHNRAWWLAQAGGSWLAIETVTRLPYFRKMAMGWRIVSFFGLGAAYREVFNWHNAYQYNPLMGAYLRKYDQVITSDMWEMRDRKREFYEIDTSQYMNYSVEEADQFSHENMGPQPDGEYKDSSWLVELDKFLAGKENHLKDHPKFIKHEYEFTEKSFPSADQANELIRGKH